jgi:hypothetical protein
VFGPSIGRTDMTAVVIEVVLPAECQSIAGALEYRGKLVQAATELGWAPPHTSDTAMRMIDRVPVGAGLHWTRSVVD